MAIKSVSRSHAKESVNILKLVQLPNSAFTARESGTKLVAYPAFESRLIAHSAWPNGSPPSLPKTKPKSSKMSLSSYCQDAPECAIFSSTKVTWCLMIDLVALLTYPDTKVVYRRYASLFFIAGCSSTDNELITLEVVHRYVEQMDKYYGNVCELDIIFNFQKAYFILDELLLAGEMQESSKKNVLRCISQQDSLEDMEVSHSCLSTILIGIHHLLAHHPPLSSFCSSLGFSHIWN
ncbi:MAG: hypothetical protein Q9183_003326 [Haloplaca sp. 2 TL-2023]